MNKNTRWALAIVGIAIVVGAAAYLIASKDDTTTATEKRDEPATEVTPKTGGATGATTTTPTGGGQGGSTESSGGTSPDNGRSGDDNGSGGASPDESGTGGASISESKVPTLRAGKVTKITTDKGDLVTFKVKSSSDEVVHVHGYDKEVDVPAGRTVTVRIRANIDGVFPIEFHESDQQIGSLVVNP